MGVYCCNTININFLPTALQNLFVRSLPRQTPGRHPGLPFADECHVHHRDLHPQLSHSAPMRAARSRCLDCRWLAPRRRMVPGSSNQGAPWRMEVRWKEIEGERFLGAYLGGDFLTTRKKCGCCGALSNTFHLVRAVGMERPQVAPQETSQWARSKAESLLL